MASVAMARVVALLFVAFLVAHVESGRLLLQYEHAAVTAETFPSQEVPVAETFAQHADGPVTEYNYNLPADTPLVTEDASTDEGVYATEGILVGDTTADSSPVKESYVFDARKEDGPAITPEDTTTLGFEALADQDVVQPTSDATSLSVGTRDFEFQELPDEALTQGDGPGFFAFDDSLSSP